MCCHFRIHLGRSGVALTSPRSVVDWRCSRCSWQHRMGVRKQTPMTAKIPKVKVKNPLAVTHHSRVLQMRGVDGVTATEGRRQSGDTVVQQKQHSRTFGIFFLMFHTRSALAAVEYFQFHITA